MRINETCPCGAKIEAESQDEKVVLRVVDKWRRRHNHYPRPTRYPIPYWPTTPYITYTSNAISPTTGYGVQTNPVSASGTFRSTAKSQPDER